ncbi:hypothetical protein AGR6A_Cc150071 [Agrobacterium sp. NCPPB 925]|nr:hypothetical protein AGR6A_Cc150071 [Agrobacterium sp. NCPPB 925]
MSVQRLAKRLTLKEIHSPPPGTIIFHSYSLSMKMQINYLLNAVSNQTHPFNYSFFELTSCKKCG